MNDKDIYLIAFNILKDISDYEGSSISKEEGEAFGIVMDVIARKYALEVSNDIRFYYGDEELFSSDVLERIKIYNAAAEKSIAGDNGTEQIG